MKRFIAFLLLLTLLCTAASADVQLRQMDESYCVAHSRDGQHCAMIEPLPDDQSAYRLYIRHADGSRSQIFPTGFSDQADPQEAAYFDCWNPRMNAIRVCGNTLLLKPFSDSSFRTTWLVNMVTGEAVAQDRAGFSISGTQAAVIVSNAKTNGQLDQPAVVFVLDGERSMLREQPIPDGMYIFSACPLKSGILISTRTGDAYALIWLDAAGNEVRRLPCAQPYEALYYDENTDVGLGYLAYTYRWSWFNPHMAMWLQMPELDADFETIEGFLAYIDANPLYASLIPEAANTRSSMNSLQPIGLTETGDLLFQWNKLGWLCLLDPTTLQLTPLLSENDDLDMIGDLGGKLYRTVWNGAACFCLPGELQPGQYIEIDHPGLR